MSWNNSLGNNVGSENIIKGIRQELRKSIEREYKAGAERYFKERIKIHGVRTPIVRKISQKYFSLIKNKEPKDVLRLSQVLLSSGYGEEKTIAFDWAYRLRKKYQKSDFRFFENWLKKHVSNWGACDDFCGHLLGYFIFQFPELIPQVKRWARSKNRWLRRASAVILIYSIRKGKSLDDIFNVSSRLLSDKDDLVQKGYGWALKEASSRYQQEVFNYVMRNKKEMPRTALRYAIEKIPQDLKKKAMG